MSRKIKIIWDFYGDKAEKTAIHHEIHLREFMDKHKLELLDSGVSSAADFHFMAYLTIPEKDVKIIRDALKPQRAFVVE
ncbi:MAG: hypothetical protein HYZ14_08470 [Bacteroidetes bacterium]|nr:hypothetical protein [Bacteroidota bacterium]